MIFHFKNNLSGTCQNTFDLGEKEKVTSAKRIYNLY